MKSHGGGAGGRKVTLEPNARGPSSDECCQRTDREQELLTASQGYSQENRSNALLDNQFMGCGQGRMARGRSLVYEMPMKSADVPGQSEPVDDAHTILHAP